MFRGVLTVLALCVVTMAMGTFGNVSAQDRKNGKAGKVDDSRSAQLVSATSIQQMQHATLDKYSGRLVTSPAANKARTKRQSSGDETLKDQMSNSFMVGGGYNHQAVSDMPVDYVQGVFATAFYYPVAWVGFGGEYQYGRGTRNSTVGASAVRDRLTRHVAVFGPEFSGYPSDNTRIFVHPLVGIAKERLSRRIGSATTTSEDTNLAVQLGGGLDYRLTNTFAWRVFQFDYLGIRRSNSWQNNYRLATGIAIRPH